ncbi:hypothetical protein CAEBREN_16738 [Caenorhabditis brenneri]|uniref:Uncharacterized protein n=1 Tax=Caenorhabditis brenneri TaxID=135651 RepID=G0MHZ1_CAEBE|nr:hypothetical protein CAEBREN_16738 [Caenorhabditis brenneri]
MEFVPAPEKTHGPLAESNSLRRYNASFAEFLNCDINAFIRVLCDHHDDLILKKIDPNKPLEPTKLTEPAEPTEDAEPTEQPDVEEIPEPPRYQVDQPKIKCPQCHQEAKHSSDLLNHLLTHVTDEVQLKRFHLHRVVTKDVNNILAQAMDAQMKESFLHIKIENSDYTIGCCWNSPLFRFLGQRHLKVYIDEEPLIRTSLKQRMIKIDLKRDGKVYPVFFSWVTIDKHRNRIKKHMQEKRKKHLSAYYKQNFQQNGISFLDVVKNKDRTEEENKELAKALNLPEDFTAEQLKEAIESMEAYKPTIRENKMKYNAREDQDGNKLNKEQRKLISTLTGNMLFVPEGKRRTRNRNYNNNQSYGASTVKKVKIEEPDEFFNEEASTSTNHVNMMDLINIKQEVVDTDEVDNNHNSHNFNGPCTSNSYAAMHVNEDTTD